MIYKHSLKLMMVTALLTLLFSGNAAGRAPEQIDTLKKLIQTTWNDAVLRQPGMTAAAFEKEAAQIRLKVARVVQQEPLTVTENKAYADFTELFRRSTFVQQLENKSVVPLEFYKLVDEVDINGPLFATLHYATVSNFLNAYIALRHYRAGKPRPTMYEGCSYALEHLQNDKVKADYVGGNFFVFVQYHMMDSQTLKLVKDINKMVKDEAFKKKVNERAAFYAPIMAGKPAPDFQLPDRHGKMVKLSDYRGKFVVIDIWATWCGGCIANLPYFAAIEEELKDRKDVVFMNIGWEEEGVKAKWLQFLEDKKMKGIQLIAERSMDAGRDKQDGLREKFRLIGIPRYIIIDREGRFVDSYAPYPSKPEFKELLLKTIGN